MPSSNNTNYEVEKIISKRIDQKGRTFYLIKWKGIFPKITQNFFYVISFFAGYSSSENSWEPENNVVNCQDVIKTFEAEQAKKNESKDVNSNASQGRKSQRTTRSSLSTPKQPINKSERPIRISSQKRTYSDDSIITDDEDDNGYIEKKLNKSSSSKRSRKSTSDTEETPSIDSDDSDILDTTKLDNILDVRRNKKTNTIEYHIQVKKVKKTIWIKSDQLTEDYAQQVVDFLEEKYV
jgi:hypothetical protein